MRNVTARPFQFLAVFLFVFFIASVALFVIDFVPEEPKSFAEGTPVAVADVVFASEVITNTGTNTDTRTVTGTQVPAAPAAGTNTSSGTLPVRVVVPSVGIDTNVVNPTSTDIKVLDDALTKGAVRYPASATLGENAGMLIFGHQSRLPIVKNRAFKAFAGLHTVENGEEIVVYSGNQMYRYRVTSVEHKSALDGVIEFPPGKRTLVLATCDSFGERTDRYVVTAEFVSQETII